MIKLNPKNKRAAFSLSEFKKRYPNSYPNKNDGFVLTFIHNNIFKSRFFKTEDEVIFHFTKTILN
jgi:hypothetical protein